MVAAAAAAVVVGCVGHALWRRDGDGMDLAQLGAHRIRLLCTDRAQMIDHFLHVVPSCVLAHLYHHVSQSRPS